MTRPLRYVINVTLDGCVDHRSMRPDEDMHQYHMQNILDADAMLLGRVTYEMMEAGWRHAPPVPRPAWMEPFATAINAARKYVVSRTLTQVDWNAELLRGDLGAEVRRLKEQPGRVLQVGGVQLPLALAELGLIDEYEFLVQPRIAGHGPALLSGLSKFVDLEVVSRRELGSGAVVTRYRPI